MSLLNDMLKDIDAKESKQTTLSDAAPSGKTKSAKQTKIFLPLIAGIAVIYFLIVELNVFGLMPKKSEPLEVPKPIELNSKWLNKASELKASDETNASLKEDSSAETKSVTEGLATTVSVSDNERGANPKVKLSSINKTPVKTFNGDARLSAGSNSALQLVELAYKALEEDRLLMPEANNAFHLFSSALLIDSNNSSAQAGLADLKQKLWDLFNARIQARNIESAKNLFSLVEKREVDMSLIERMRGALYDAQTVNTSQSDSTQSHGYKPQNQAGQVNINISNMDTHYATQIASKDFYKIKGPARDWALNNPAHSALTQIALADAYAKQFMFDELNGLHKNLAKVAPAGASYAKARLALAKGDMPAAIKALEKNNFSGEADVYRLRLLAASHQAQKNYDHAVRAYQVVTRSPQAISSDWLGLAVSYDALKSHSGAYSAYHKFLSMGHHDDRIIAFARQRAAEISLMMNIGR